MAATPYLRRVGRTWAQDVHDVFWCLSAPERVVSRMRWRFSRHGNVPALPIGKLRLAEPANTRGVLHGPRSNPVCCQQTFALGKFRWMKEHCSKSTLSWLQY